MRSSIWDVTVQSCTSVHLSSLIHQLVFLVVCVQRKQGFYFVHTGHDRCSPWASGGLCLPVFPSSIMVVVDILRFFSYTRASNYLFCDPWSLPVQQPRPVLHLTLSQKSERWWADGCNLCWSAVLSIFKSVVCTLAGHWLTWGAF